MRLKSRICLHSNLDMEKEDICKDSGTAPLITIIFMLQMVSMMPFRMVLVENSYPTCRADQ